MEGTQMLWYFHLIVAKAGPDSASKLIMTTKAVPKPEITTLFLMATDLL
jgi:hypothetical protein